jgi:hypothetical protein
VRERGRKEREKEGEKGEGGKERGERGGREGTKVRGEVLIKELFVKRRSYEIDCHIATKLRGDLIK